MSIGTIAAMGLMACGADSSPSASESPVTSSPTPTSSAPSGEFGPLAVVEAPGGGPDASGGTGSIHITATCATMTRENGDTVLLVWQNSDVTWDDASHEITFVRAGGLANETPITLRDGDTIRIGGAPLDNLPPQTDFDWLAAPQPGCDGERWFVSGVIKEQFPVSATSAILPLGRA